MATSQYDAFINFADMPSTANSSTGPRTNEDIAEENWTRGQNRLYPEPDTPIRLSKDQWKHLVSLPTGLTFTRYHMDISALDEVADCSAPEPSLTNENFKGMPSTEEFSLDHNWTDENDKGIYSDLQGLKGKREVEVGPLAKRMAIKMNRNSQCPSTLTIQIDSTSSDPLGEYSISFPSEGWQDQEYEFRARIDRKARHLLHTEMLSLYGARRNYHSRIQNGLTTFLDLDLEPQNRVLLVAQCTLEQASEELMYKYPSAYAIRKLNHTECCYLSNNCHRLRIRNIKIIGDNAFDISFGCKDEMRSFLKANPNAVFFPSKLEANLSSNDSEVYGMKLSWYPYPSLRSAKLVMKNAKDVGYACFVLNEHIVKCMPSRRYDSNNRELDLSLFEGDTETYDNEMLEHKVRTILSHNHLEYEKISIFRSRDRPLSANAIWQKIHRRIGMCALLLKIWEGDEPLNTESWEKYITHNHQNLDWEVHLDDYKSPFAQKEFDLKKMREVHRRANAEEFDGIQGVTAPATDDPLLGVQRTATVTFKNREVAEKIINYLLPISPRWETFQIAHKDKRGVRFAPFYRIQRNVPHCIRGVINDFLDNEEKEFRRTSDYLEDDWCQYLDGPLNTQTLVLQGWPMAPVLAAAGRLEKRLTGLEIDCTDPEGAGRLLYGVGLAYVNKIQRENKGEVVISVCRLEKKIWIIGDLEEACPKTRDKLMSFCKNREKFTIKYSISLSKPRFLPFFRDHISEVVNSFENPLQSYLGNPNMTIAGHELRFEGNVVQYERLQELLDELQKKMLDDYRAEVFSIKKLEFRDINCPLCLAQITHSNYRLTICGHLYCQDCLCQMISFQMKHNELPVRCRYSKSGKECLELVAVRDVMLLLFDKNFCRFPYFFKDRLELLLRATTDYAIKESKGRLRHCPRPDCKGLFVKKLPNESGSDELTCKVCQFKVCRNCFYPSHPGVSCAIETAIRRSADESINFYMKKLGGRVRRCPNENCQGVIEKDAGCNHLHCLFCRTHFCWLCNFTGDHECQIYAHMRSTHGGTGGGYDYLDFPPGLGPPPGFPIHAPNLPLVNPLFGQHLHILGMDDGEFDIPLEVFDNDVDVARVDDIPPQVLNDDDPPHVLV